MRIATPEIVVAILLICVGCDRGPQAPVLRDGPVYDNRSEGLRFLVPDGWRQTASALLPPGDIEDELFLVRYTLTTPESGALLVILVMQEKSPINAGEHHQGPSFRVEKWTPVGEKQQLEVNGATIEHYEYKARVDVREMIKDVYVLRRGGRLYSFIGLYAATDAYARQQISRAINSLQLRP